MTASAEIEWRDGDVPFSPAYGDSFYQSDGLGEARHVFLGGSDLPARFRAGFHVGEIGFGTGLNALVAGAAWRAAGQGGPLRYTAFEAAPLGPAAMARALGAFAALAPLAGELVAALGGGRRARLPWLDLTLVVGDARVTLAETAMTADAWFLDGFAPSRNPEAWEPGLLAAVAARTAPGGTVATFTAAGSVRRGLAAAGFVVERVPGFGAKRHMTRGRLA